MKTAILIVLAAICIPTVALADKKPQTPGACTFSKPERLKTHANVHIKYPADGKAIKASCKKEWPDEFSKDEWACFDASVKDDHTYNSSDELISAVGAK